MTDRKPSDGGPKTREERLAAALRANLRRRKASAHTRREEPAETGNPPKLAESLENSGPSGRRS